MANYKVPQDVEADDKLLGPFSFRQFVYLMIVAAAIALAWVLWRILPFLAIIPLPAIVFFGALALPLRKDQPMEIYLAAIMSFYLKPRLRMWDPDGMETLVAIAAPQSTEVNLTKTVSVSEAEQRLVYLSNIADTRGWAVRGVHEPHGSSMNDDVYNEAQQTEDLLDESNTVARNLEYMIAQKDSQRHQAVLNQFKQQARAADSSRSTPTPTVAPQSTAQASVMLPPVPTSYPDPYAVLGQAPVATVPSPFTQTTAPTPAPQAQTTPAQPQPNTHLAFNPYPTNMNQKVIQPLGKQPVPPPTPVTPEQPSATEVSPDIINLANTNGLSVETIAREARRIHDKEASSDEVFISLR